MRSLSKIVLHFFNLLVDECREEIAVVAWGSCCGLGFMLWVVLLSCQLSCSYDDWLGKYLFFTLGSYRWKYCLGISLIWKLAKLSTEDK